jgi:hemerythrin-like domain-containing protein
VAQQVQVRRNQEWYDESVPIQINRRPDHDFDEPLGLLSDCHRRIEHFLDTLIAVHAKARGEELSANDRSALEGSLQYFRTAAPRHTADEEESLFPRLRESHDPIADQTLATIDRLEHDHEAANSHHQAVEMLVRRWLDTGTLMLGESAELGERLARLRALYRQHIAVEDQELFPAAARVLNADQIGQIGREMAARRGVRARAPQT